MKYQGNAVTSRAAKAGDPNYDASKDQVVITLANGTEKTVLRSETTND